MKTDIFQRPIFFLLLLRFFLLGTIILFLTGCITFAPPPPLMTLGGPGTAPKGTSEAGIAVGTGVALFEKAHAGAQGWLARYKYGLNDKFDLGIDFSGAARNDGQYFGTKISLRYQISKKSRFELGFGAADDSDGKSLNTDIAYTIGSGKKKKWESYSSLRLSYAHGFAGNSLTIPGQTKGDDSIPPPNAFFGLINFGVQGRICSNQKIIFEGGFGYIFPERNKCGPAFYISSGLLFSIGKQ